MTTTYDPFHAAYLDETDLREELDRVYDLCHGCRLCFKFCPSFPTLFEFIDAFHDQDSSRMTPEQQDQVVDECFQCKLCYVNCPYTPDQHEWNLDFPRLMMRADQMLHEKRPRGFRQRLTDQAVANTDLVGKVSTTLAAPANAAIVKPGSVPRKLLEKVVGISSERVLPPYAKERFSTWFGKRKEAGEHEAGLDRQGRAVLFPTCLVEYQNTEVGKDTVKVYERNGVECSLPEGEVCCGAPFLHQGDVARFRKLAEKNVAVLAAAIRDADSRGETRSPGEAGSAGEPVIAVAQPTCSYVLKHDYPDYVGGADAELVAERTRDVSEYLMELHRGDDTRLDTDFVGSVPETTTYHAPCHLRAQNIGLKSRDLMKLTGTKLTVVAECSGIDGTWGLRAENLAAARDVAKKMAGAIEKADSEVVAGDCTLANGGIVLETGTAPRHPLSVMARAYGFDAEPGER